MKEISSRVKPKENSSGSGSFGFKFNKEKIIKTGFGFLAGTYFLATSLFPNLLSAQPNIDYFKDSKTYGVEAPVQSYDGDGGKKIVGWDDAQTYSTPSNVEKELDEIQINKLELKYASEVKSIDDEKVKKSKKPPTYASEVDNTKYEGTKAPLKNKTLKADEFPIEEVFIGDIPMKNMSGEVTGYTTYAQAMKDGLYRFSGGEAFYDKATSDSSRNNVLGGDAISDYGDQYLNSFKQPNLINQGEFTLNYFGSGDADGDGDLDWDDYDTMVLGTQNFS